MPDPYAPLKMQADRNLTGQAGASYGEAFESGLQYGWQQSTAAGLQRERQDLLSTWIDRFKTETGVDVWHEAQKRLMAATGKSAEQTAVTDHEVAQTLFELMNKRAEKADQTISDSAAIFEAELADRYKSTAKDFAETMSRAPWGPKYLGGYAGAMVGGMASDPALLPLLAVGGPEVVGARTLGAVTRAGAMLRGLAVGGAIDAATNAAYSYFDQVRMNQEYARAGVPELGQSPGEVAAYGAIGGFALGGLTSAFAARQLWRHATVDEPARQLLRTIDERARVRDEVRSELRGEPRREPTLTEPLRAAEPPPRYVAPKPITVAADVVQRAHEITTVLVPVAPERIAEAVTGPGVIVLPDGATYRLSPSFDMRAFDEKTPVVVLHKEGNDVVVDQRGTALTAEQNDVVQRTLNDVPAVKRELKPEPTRAQLNEAALEKRPVDAASAEPPAKAPKSGPDAPPHTTPEPSPAAVLDQFVEWRQALDRTLGPEAGAAAAELLAREAAQVAATGTETPAEVLARALGLDTGSMHGSRAMPEILDTLDSMPLEQRLDALSSELRLSGEPGHVALANQLDAVEELRLIIRTCLSKGVA